MDLAVQWFDRLSQFGLLPDIFTVSSIIDGYAKQGQMDLAVQWFDRLSKFGLLPDIFTVNSIINGYAKQGQMNSTTQWFDRLSDFGLSPDITTFNSMIEVCSRSKNFQKGEDLFIQLKNKHQVNEVTYNVMIDLYGFWGRIDRAIAIFEELKQTKLPINSNHYNSIIEACWRNKDPINHEKYQEEKKTRFK